MQSLLNTTDESARNAHRVQTIDPLLRRRLTHTLRDPSDHELAVSQPTGVGGQRGITREVIQSQRKRGLRPLRVVPHGNDERAVGGVK